MTTLQELAVRLDKATGPDRELDRDIHYILSGEEGMALVFAIPEYTASLDAVAALQAKVLPGWEWLISSFDPHHPLKWPSAVLVPPEWTLDKGMVLVCNHHTLAIAWLKAIVAAKIEDGE